MMLTHCRAIFAVITPRRIRVGIDGDGPASYTCWHTECRLLLGRTVSSEGLRSCAHLCGEDACESHDHAEYSGLEFAGMGWRSTNTPGPGPRARGRARGTGTGPGPETGPGTGRAPGPGARRPGVSGARGGSGPARGPGPGPSLELAGMREGDDDRKNRRCATYETRLEPDLDTWHSYHPCGLHNQNKLVRNTSEESYRR